MTCDEVKVDAAEVARGITVKVKIVGIKRAVWRLRIAGLLINLASFIGGINIVQVQSDA